MVTGHQLIQEAVGELGQDKRLEAELLLASVLHYNRAKLLAYDNEAVAATDAAAFRSLIVRRKAEEPLQYLTGMTSFMGMDFLVTPDVLIPRFDTEILVEQACKLLKGDESQKPILDLCTGSGAIAVSLAKYIARAEVWASDLSAGALVIAAKNAKANGAEVRFCCGDLFKPFQEQRFAHYFQLIASNPPYITTAEFKELPAEVRKEPTMALWGGADGLKFYQDIAGESKAYLQQDGYLIMEIGFAQGQAVREIVEQQGFSSVKVIKDWQGHDRVVYGQWQ